MAKIVISSIGTRGDVQPILALAVELKSLGHTTTLCVAPDFQSWVESFGITFLPLGPPLKGFSTRAPGGKRLKFTRAQAQQMVSASVRTQFKVISDAAQGADLIVSGGALQTAGRSIAEKMNIPYVYAAYCPVALRSRNLPPPRVRTQSLPRFVAELLWTLNGCAHGLPRFVSEFLWMFDERSWNSLFRDPVNEQRAAIGLAPISNVSRYVTTDRPWLAADAALGPAGATNSMQVYQTGAWLLRDSSSLPDELEMFLARSEPPIYFGFGSTARPELTVQAMLDAARKVGRRAIVSQGWANLRLIDDGNDILSIGDVNHEKLFPRVAAIVHHGGAGTTTAAARAGTPQLIAPQFYDQFYWARRIEELGVGASLQNISDSVADDLASRLRTCLSPDTQSYARALASRIETNGVRNAAQRLVKEYL